VFHIELRQFPHNFCRFNLSEPELRTEVLQAWARAEAVELGGRRWDPRQASLTVIEGPELSMQELSLGRGWRNAQRSGSDVTVRMLALARAGEGNAAAGGPPAAQRAAPTDSGEVRALLADPLLAELRGLLGEDADPLIRAWVVALGRHPDRTPSECLALAEDLVRG
jgi:hypothetical protein